MPVHSRVDLPVGASGVVGGAREAMLIQWVVGLAVPFVKGGTGRSQRGETSESGLTDQRGTERPALDDASISTQGKDRQFTQR